MKRALFIVFFAACSLMGYTQRPKLIEFGWDYPDVDQLSKGLPAMQNTPFDGICFSLQRTIMDAFDTAVLKDSYFNFEKLRKLQWGKYSDNYIILRGFGATGSRWQDDRAWKIFIKNMQSLSKAMQAGRVKGILFDAEYYFDDSLRNPWTYTKTQYPDQSLEEIQSIIKNRGSQFIRALQQYKPNLSFLSIWLSGLIAEEKKTKPVLNTRHLLLLSFIEGILEAKNKQVTVIDGNETAYWYYKPSQFLESIALLKKTSAGLMRSKKTKAAALNILTGQTVYYDGIMARNPLFDQGFDNTQKWNWLTENINYAMASSNSVVWFYSERNNWWENVNDTLLQVLQASKNAFAGPRAVNTKKGNSLKPVLFKSLAFNEGKGYFYMDDSKNPMKTGEVAFSYKWDGIHKTLSIQFGKNIPVTVMVFANNIPSTINANIQSTLKIKLSKFKKGKIIILAKYAANLEASAIHVY